MMQDRLSALPDDIVVQIVSLLPIQSAVATDVLSSRWRRLWSKVTSINLTREHVVRSDVQRLRRRSLRTSVRTSVSWTDLLGIVDLLLPKLSSPCIRSLVLRESDHRLHTCSDVYINVKNSLLRQVCARNVEEIHIEENIGCECLLCRRCKALDREVPLCIFKTQSLVVLELSECFTSSPDDVDVSLPNLKRLCMKYDISCKKIVAKLVQSCTVLEDLSLEIDGYSSTATLVLDLPCQNLKRLNMKFIKYTSTAIIVKVLVTSLELKHLVARSSNHHSFLFVDKAFALLKDGIPITLPFRIVAGRNLTSEFSGQFSAVKDIVFGNGDIQSGVATRPRNLLSELSGMFSVVKNIVLGNNNNDLYSDNIEHFFGLHDQVEHLLPPRVAEKPATTVFSNLTYLKLLVDSGTQFNDMMDVLEQFRSLEVLVLQSFNYDEEKFRWTYPEVQDSSPRYLLTRVRQIEIEISSLIDEKVWLNCAKHFLSISQALEQLVVTIKYWAQVKGCELNLFKELKFYEELQKCPRSSSHYCDIQFSGEHVSGTFEKSCHLNGDIACDENHIVESTTPVCVRVNKDSHPLAVFPSSSESHQALLSLLANSHFYCI